MICKLHDKTGSVEETLPAFQLFVWPTCWNYTPQKPSSIRRHAMLHPCNVMALCAQPSFASERMQNKNSRVKVCVTNLVCRHFTENVKISDLACQMDQFLILLIYLTYPVGIEHTGGEAKLRTWLDKPSGFSRSSPSCYFCQREAGSKNVLSTQKASSAVFLFFLYCENGLYF